MKSIKPYLFTLLSLFLTSTMFISCSNENNEANDLNANQITLETQTLETPTIENPKEVIPVKSYSLEENVNKFSIEYLNNSNKIAVIIKENKGIMLDASLKLKMSSCKSENELFTVLKNSNIENYPAMILLLKQQKKLCVNFALENKSYAELNGEKRKKMMLDAFLANGMPQKKSSTTSKTAQGDCLTDYQNNISDVLVDHIYNLAQIGSVAAGAEYYTVGGATPEVIVVGLVAVLIEEIYFEYNVGVVIDRYEECVANNCSQKKKPIKY